MRHPYATLIALLIASGSNAQIVFDHGDLPVPGDIVVRYVDTLPGSGPGGSGPGQVWDFGDASPHVERTTTVVLPSATPFASSFTTSNLAYDEGGGNYGFFTASPSALITTGFAGDPLGTGTPLVITLNPTLKVHDLPRTFGNHFNDNYRFEVIVDGSAFGVHSVRLRHRGNVFDSCDAHGQLTTPMGTYDALRVKSTEFSVDSIWIRLLAFLPWQFVQAVQDTSTVYSWLAKETKLPVAEMSLDSLGDPARLVYSSIPPTITTGFGRHGNAGFNVYPVPARDGFHLERSTASGHRLAELFTMDGRLVRSVPLGSAVRQWIPSGDLCSGAYLLRCSGSDGPDAVLRVVVE